MCQLADTEAVVTVDAAQPVGNTDEPSMTVTRGQNFTHPKRTTILPKPQQPLKGLKSVSSPSRLLSFLLFIFTLLSSCPLFSSSLFFSRFFFSHFTSSLPHSHLVSSFHLFFSSSPFFLSSPFLTCLLVSSHLSFSLLMKFSFIDLTF